MFLQSAVLGLGAYLVIQGEASAGIIIAGSILSARALSPLDQVIAHWKAFGSARQSWKRLLRSLQPFPSERASCPFVRRPMRSRSKVRR